MLPQSAGNGRDECVMRIELGRHRVEFTYQAPDSFGDVNQSPYLGTLKTSAGFARLAGIELTLLDCVRYFRKAGGINGVAQIAQFWRLSGDTRHGAAVPSPGDPPTLAFG